MLSMRKFQFETFLDQREEPEETTAPNPPSLFTLEEKDGAYQEGYHEGFQKGEKEAFEREILIQERQNQALLKQIEEKIGVSFEEIEAHKKNIIQQVMSCVHPIVEKLFPILEKNLGAVQVQHLIQEVIASESPPVLKVTTHPQLQTRLQEQFKKINTPCAITFETNEDFELSNCRIEWGDSGVERIVPQIIADLETLLKSFENVFEESNKKIEPSEER